MTQTVEYRLSLANHTSGGRNVANLYGVCEYRDGMRTGYALPPQASRVTAERFADFANVDPRDPDVEGMIAYQDRILGAMWTVRPQSGTPSETTP